jgi:hypothetical protein
LSQLLALEEFERDGPVDQDDPRTTPERVVANPQPTSPRITGTLDPGSALEG